MQRFVTDPTGNLASALSLASASMGSDVVLVRAFNDAINARRLDRLEALMHPEHRFIDAAGAKISGREECLAAWASFFASFPDYRNVFERVDVESPGRVVATGYSQCSFEPLDGPALWRATLDQGSVIEWRVEDPTTRE